MAPSLVFCLVFLMQEGYEVPYGEHVLDKVCEL